VLCATLVVSVILIAARIPPIASREAVLASSTEVCQKATACVPPAEIESQLAQCIEMQMRPAVNYEARGFLLHLQRAVLEKCGSLNCDDFKMCFDRELSLLVLPVAEKERLLKLVCEAMLEENNRAPGATDESRWKAELDHALNKLQNKPLAEAILQEGESRCKANIRLQKEFYNPTIKARPR
jgi:hypothetical protein